MSMNAFASAQAYLYALGKRASRDNLDSIQKWLQTVGNPQLRFPTLHVAGTNGKGSVCAMLEAIYRIAGYKTGLYTSPHLVYVGERVQIARKPIPPETLAHYVNQLRQDLEAQGSSLSFFEHMTTIAFEYFAQEQVQLAMIETGIGGALDATNLVLPEISIITSIGRDHTQRLGNSIESIAIQKGGIIKHKRPVVLGWLPPAAEREIRTIATALQAPIYTVKEAYGPDLLTYPKTALAGDLQRVNAATASLACQVLADRFPVSSAAIEQGLLDVSWPGRWETIHLKDDKTLILDATHNENGIPMLAGNLQALYEKSRQKPIMVTGVLGIDRAAAIMPCVAQFASEIVLVKVRQPRASDPQVLQALIPWSFKGKVSEQTVEGVFNASHTCRLGKPGATIVVTGSIYLLGEVLSQVCPQGINQSTLQELV